MAGKNPLKLFFSLAPKDPKRKALYDYYLFWVLFLAFLMIAVDNFIRFINTRSYTNLGWSIVMFIIAYFNYYTLKAMYETKEMMKDIKQVETTLESPEEMLKDFNNLK